MLEPSALDVLKPGLHCDMPALFGALQERGTRTIAYPMHEPWFDVGRPDDYEQVGHAEFLQAPDRNRVR